MIVCENQGDAINAIEELMVKRIFGDAGDRIVIEERIRGQEVSLIVLSMALVSGHFPRVETTRILPTVILVLIRGEWAVFPRFPMSAKIWNNKSLMIS